MAETPKAHPDDHRLKTYNGAVVLVTGGASGIGRAIAEALANQHARAIVLLDRQAAEEFATFLTTKHSSSSSSSLTAVKVCQVDVRNFEDVERVVRETKEEYGRIDYIFNNAGTTVSDSIEGIGVEGFNYVMDVNLRGVSNGVFAAYPIMKEQGFGHIVNTASMAGLVPSGEGMAAYGASKHAVVGLSLNLRIEAARHGVQVSALCPGFIRTPILRGGGKYGRTRENSMQLDRDISKLGGSMDPRKFAEQALKLIAKNKPIIVVPGFPYNAIWFFYRRFPNLLLYLSRKQNDKMMERLEKHGKENK